LDVAPIDSKEYPKNVRYFRVDVRDFGAVKKALSGVDAVVHAAAALPLWKSEDILSTTIEGTRNVLEAALQVGVKRVVFISSTAVYTIPQPHPIYEDSKLAGIGPYGTAKIEAEGICAEYRRKGLVVAVNRPKTFIGTGRLGVFQILYDWVESGKRIPLIGDGGNKYQLLEVEDLVDSIYLMLTAPAEKANDTFNVGAREFGMMREDFGALCDFAQSGARVMATPAWLVKPVLEFLWVLRVSPLYKWVYGTADQESYVSIEKAERQLGFRPKYSNKQALIRSYGWYLAHKGEISTEGGVTHRVAWKQGILKLVKKFM
jgi:nucleoside-diphosphate-sugar epimerase